MSNLLLDLGLGFLIGLSLGLLGGGGSILTVPALVYFAGQTPQSAVATSLAIVCANSAFGAYFHRRQGALNWRVALVFSAAGMIAAFFASKFTHRLPPQALMTVFAFLMLLVGGMMLLPPRRPSNPRPAEPGLLTILATGVGVGLLTGLLGVGGGFLIVPALVMIVGLPVVEAVSTSLIIISANSLAGFIGHWSQNSFDLELALVFALAGLAGAFAGARLAFRLPAHRLRQAFGVFVIGLGIFLLSDNWVF